MTHLNYLISELLRDLAEEGFDSQRPIDPDQVVNVLRKRFGALQDAWYLEQAPVPRVSPFIELRLNGSVVTVNINHVLSVGLDRQAERISVTLVNGSTYSVLRDDGASIYATYERITGLAKEATK